MIDTTTLEALIEVATKDNRQDTVDKYSFEKTLQLAKAVKRIESIIGCHEMMIDNGKAVEDCSICIPAKFSDDELHVKVADHYAKFKKDLEQLGVYYAELRLNYINCNKQMGGTWDVDNFNHNDPTRADYDGKENKREDNTRHDGSVTPRIYTPNNNEISFYNEKYNRYEYGVVKEIDGKLVYVVNKTVNVEDMLKDMRMGK